MSVPAENPGPQPARLVFLDHLPCEPVQSKVRFLGCVQSSSSHDPTAPPILVHRRPSTPNISVQLDVSLITENLDAQELQAGAWVNVIGSITRIGKNKMGLVVQIQAVMIWSAGAINIQRYEAALEETQQLDKEFAEKE